MKSFIILVSSFLFILLSSPKDIFALYTIQVEYLTNRSSAESLVEELQNKGYPAYLEERKGKDGYGGFRIRIGRFRDRKQAERMAEKLKKEAFNPWIVKVEEDIEPYNNSSSGYTIAPSEQIQKVTRIYT